MTLYELTILAATGAALALAVWVLVRHWSAWRGGPFPDVPDAPPTAEPLEAPGMTPPYSSLDPYAPPKRLPNRAGGDEASESD